MTERDIQDLFQNIKEYQKHSVAENKLVCCGLKPSLRPYQEEAVKWMIKREEIDNTTAGKWYFSNRYHSLL